MYHFREVARSDPRNLSHIVFSPDGVHHKFLEMQLFKDEDEARNFLLDEKYEIRIAAYAFHCYTYLKPTSIECVVPNHYFVKNRKHDGTYHWVELVLEDYGPITYQKAYLFTLNDDKQWEAVKF